MKIAGVFLILSSLFLVVDLSPSPLGASCIGLRTSLPIMDSISALLEGVSNTQHYLTELQKSWNLATSKVSDYWDKHKAKSWTAPEFGNISIDTNSEMYERLNRSADVLEMIAANVLVALDYDVEIFAAIQESSDVHMRPFLVWPKEIHVISDLSSKNFTPGGLPYNKLSNNHKCKILSVPLRVSIYDADFFRSMLAADLSRLVNIATDLVTAKSSINFQMVVKKRDNSSSAKSPTFKFFFVDQPRLTTSSPLAEATSTSTIIPSDELPSVKKTSCWTPASVAFIIIACVVLLGSTYHCMNARRGNWLKTLCPGRREENQRLM